MKRFMPHVPGIMIGDHRHPAGRPAARLISVLAGLGLVAALVLALPARAGASTAMTFHLSPCPGSGATGNGSVTISQTGKSLTIIDRISNDLPDAGQFILVADATQGFAFGNLFVNSKGSALFEVHQTTTIPTGVNSGDSIVFLRVDEEGNPILPPRMASDSGNC
jgi:hypothetical protein